MRLALLTPSAAPAVGGNAVTVSRVARGLAARGVEARVWDVSASPEARVQDEVSRFSPAAVHAFHAFRAGPLGLRLAQRLGRPLVVTITGTDANGDLADPARAPAVRRVLAAAQAITVFHESMTARIAAALGDRLDRLAVVPQSVVFTAPTGGAVPPTPEGGPVLLFPAGLRAVKRPRFPLRPLERLRQRFPGLVLLYAGPVLERDEADALLAELAARPWARYLGPVPHALMPALLERADLVLNCSAAEGGMANSVLEALALGRAVLASDIPGNRSVVADGVRGSLYRDEGDFEARAAALLADPALRRRLGEAGRRYVETHLGPERELDGYLAVYARVAEGAAAPPGIDGG